MRALLQRVSRAEVSVEGEVVASIQKGLLLLLGIHRDDGVELVAPLVKKVAELRIFEDEGGKMNRSLLDCRGELLLVSQFTLYANCRGGRRPDFLQAAPPAQARELYEAFYRECTRLQLPVQRGIFGAEMSISLVNEGPVTLMLDTL